jgi:hypothetical protein
MDLFGSGIDIKLKERKKESVKALMKKERQDETQFTIKIG